MIVFQFQILTNLINIFGKIDVLRELDVYNIKSYVRTRNVKMSVEKMLLLLMLVM